MNRSMTHGLPHVAEVPRPRGFTRVSRTPSRPRQNTPPQHHRNHATRTDEARNTTTPARPTPSPTSNPAYMRARARMYAGLLVGLGVGLAGVVVLRASSVRVAWFRWCCGGVFWRGRLGVRETRVKPRGRGTSATCGSPCVMERFTRCGSNALDSKALHCLLSSATLRSVVQRH